MIAALNRSAPTGESDPILDRLVEEISEKVQAGEPVDFDAIARAHPECADRLRRLLPALELMADFGQSSVTELKGGVPAADEPIAPLGELGDFRILREVGRGGMGVVYEAEQISLGRRVALKVLPFAAALDAKQLQRFKNEAQAAAHLQHQNIVPVHGVGCERGVHYYAMQFVEGQTLAAVIHDLRQFAGLEAAEPEATTADARSLAGELASGRWAPAKRAAADLNVPAPASPRAAKSSPSAPVAKPATGIPAESSTRDPAFFRTVAHLGVQAAQALEHAHQLGVVHRDIKPANLLVDVRGNLWITDFGLAQIQGDTRLTMTGDLLGTLRYMSPEQALANRVVIDHRTDIYSLGITLYELMTLEPAFGGRDRQEVLRRIAFEEPQVPRRINPSIPMELETIVLKAMAKNTEERYATAQELAEDLERCLKDEPIRAKRPTLPQRARKWARRHRPVVWSAGISFVLLLVMAVVALSIGLMLVNREREETSRAYLAEAKRRQQTREALDVTTSLMIEDLLSKQQMLSEDHKKFLRRALEAYEEFAAETGQDEATRHGVATAHFRVGRIHSRLGLSPEAEAAYRRAAILFAKLSTDFPAIARYRRGWADTLSNLSILLWHIGRWAEAEPLHRDALVHWGRLVADSPAVAEYRLGLARCLSDLSMLLRDLDRWDESESACRDALVHWGRLVADSPAVPRYRVGKARGLNDLGILLRDLGRPAEAEAAGREALDLWGRLVADSPAVAEYRLGLARALIIRGVLKQDTGPSSEAEAAYRAALTHWNRLVADSPTIPEYRAGLARGLHDLGILLRDLGRPAEAEAAGREALDLWGRLVADSPSIPEPRRMWAQAYAERGQLFLDAGRGPESEAAYRQALALQERLVVEFPATPHFAVELGGTYIGLGHLMRDQGRPEDALQWYAKAISTLEPVHAENPRVVTAGRNLRCAHIGRADILLRLGRDAEAVKPSEREGR